MNKKTVYLREKKDLLLKTLEELTNSNIKYVLLGEYDFLPEYFEGNDIDILVDSTESAVNAFRKNGWAIQSLEGKVATRAFTLINESYKWLVVELWDKKNICSKKISNYLLTTSIKDKYGLKRSTVEGVCAWKAFKYFNQGLFGNRTQIEALKEKWTQLDKQEKNKAVALIKSDFTLPDVKSVFDYLDGKTEDLSLQVWQYIDRKKEQKKCNRIVYAGNIIFNNVISNRKILKRLLNTMKKGFNHPPLPVIAIVGNDGAGKTIFCNSLKKSLFYKTDPVHISLKKKDPALPFYSMIRPWLLKYSKPSMKRYSARSFADHINNLLDFIPFWLLETFDFFDRLIRFYFFKLWAKAGLGLVIFERYVTDRLRGEYPGPAYSLFPLEQFFPEPDHFIYFDVLPEDSLKRKSEDGHTLEEMQQKRNNYLKLMKRYNNVTIIPAELSIEESYKVACNAIFDLCQQTQNNQLK